MEAVSAANPSPSNAAVVNTKENSVNATPTM
jgi:hypothetical protein